MPNETVTLTCPTCGREIQIPAELEQFSCLYCGAKLRMAELLPPTQPAEEADRAYAEAHLLDCIRDFPKLYKQFSRKKYEASFQAHREAIRPAYEAMDRWVCAQPARRQQLLEAFADSFLEQWEAYQQGNARTRHGREQNAFADKLTLAWYTVPAIRDLELSVSQDYPYILRDRFNARYPGNIFEVGSYNEISGGFRKRGLAALFSRKD